MTSATPADPVPGSLELPRPPGTVRRFLAAHPVLVDGFVAAAYLAPAVMAGALGMLLEPSWQVAIRVMLASVAGCALVARRQHPQTVFVIAVCALGVGAILGREVDFVPALIALYALAVYRTVRSAWIGLAVTVAVTGTALTANAVFGGPTNYAPLGTTAWASGFSVLSFCTVAVLVGSNVGNHRRYLDALIDRARQLARERDQQAEIATAAERGRIAREMHDIVSHSLTVMITLADGSARLTETAPERSAATMRMVAETGRSALADMRRLLGVLHADDGAAAAHEPQPGVAELADLIERFRAAGLPVRYTVSGPPPEDVGQQLTIFRVVQEALTNALRYASLASSVSVGIRFGRDSIRILVEDDAVHSEAVAGSGRGLLGLRERVALYGGTLEAGPRRRGVGWRLAAEFDTIAARGSTEEETP